MLKMKKATDDNVCRICLKRQDTMFPLFHNRHGVSPFVKLVSITNLKIEFNDTGPSSICSQCLADLDTTVSFLEKCEQSNEALAARLDGNVDNECTNEKNGFIQCEGNVPENVPEKLKPVTSSPPSDEELLTTSVNDHDTQGSSHKDAQKELKRSELIMGTLKCPECESTRRCAHWAPPNSFSCQDCGKIFNKKYNFQIHVKRHLGERDWACPKCGSLQLTESLAQRHCRPRERRHCPVAGCGKSFTNNNNLRTHIRRHNGERPFECHDCGKRFTSKKTLRDHVRIHTGEKPYVCAICGARFTWNHLAAHARAHAGARGPHACARAGCGRRCASAAALREHARAHAPARDFACALCACKYKYKQSLNHHVRNHHGVKSSLQQGMDLKSSAIEIKIK